MPGIVEEFGLSVAELPDFITVCTRKQDLEMRIWRVLLRFSVQLEETSDVQATDETGFDHIGASQHYANRTNYIFKSMKMTALVDCETSLILDIHCSMKQPHDTQIGWQGLSGTYTATKHSPPTKGYDWDKFRHYLHEEGVRSVIKHLEFRPLDAAHNARFDDKTYHRRSVVESVFVSLRRRFDDTIRARTWFGRFRELVLKCAVRNIELSVTASNP